MFFNTLVGKRSCLILSLFLSFCLAPARAFDIHLSSSDWQPINMFVEIFLGEEQLSGQIPSDIISNDLAVSGQFRIFREGINTYSDIDEERLAAIRQRGGEYLLSGVIGQTIGRETTLNFSLYDALTGSVIGQYAISFNPDNKRGAAHNIANWIYEEITGKPGVFHTKVAYVLRREDGQNELKVSDYDGHNRLVVLASEDTIISPTWTPDGNELLYVSFERNKPIIYRQSLLTGEREIVANFKGSNSAPAVSPNQRSIAVALTEHGGVQQIYLLSGNSKVRLRESDGINTEPAFAPDGRRLAFISDEVGSPQIYEYDLDNNAAKRLTFGSRYNASPTYSQDGEAIVFVRRDDNGDNVAVLDLASGAISALTEVRLADSPSFSPNDDIVIFKDEGRKNYLATVSINGKVTMLWDSPEEGEVINPAWSPAKSSWF